MKIKIKRLHKDAILPKYAHPGDIGLDMYSLEDYTLKPGERHLFMTGFAMEFPTGYGALVMDKSSMAMKGIKTSGGVFDAGYRGEYNAHLINLGDTPYEIEKGDKIAQIVIMPITIADVEETDSLSETSRGTGGFGSTGKK